MTPFALIITAVILFGSAAAFLAAELFFPSHGLLGVFSGLFAVAGVIAMFFASQVLGAISASALVIIAPVTFYYAIKLYPHSPVGKRVMLGAPAASDVAGFSRDAQDLAALTGKRGVAATLLRPAGIVEIDGQRIDSVAEGEVIPAGAAVEVLRVSGRRVIVKAV